MGRAASRPGAARPRAAARVVLLAVLVATPGCVLLPTNDRHGLRALEQGHMLVGAWLGEWPTDSTPAIRDFERSTGARLDLVDVYLDWFTPFDNVSHTLQHIASRGSLAILTWEAQTLTTRDILDGTRTLPLRDGTKPTIDAYLDAFSRGTCAAARQAGQPVLVRVLHEMNGGWFAWGISHERPDGSRPNTDASYRAAWIRIHEAFASKCGRDVLFVYAVNHASVGEGATHMGPYPGDAYVDFVGIDGYNWGSNAPWGWQSFDTLYRDAYCAVVAGTTRPMLVNEIASTERGGSKAAWIRDFFGALPGYPRIQGFVWFHDDKYERETRVHIDWPVDSSPAARDAFSAGVGELHRARSGGPPAPPAANPC